MLHRNALFFVIAGALLAPVAFADDDKDESGKRREHRRERKEEFRQGGCKVERKWEKNGDYKEERKCDGPDRHAERKEEHDDGNCKVERKWEKNGSYKEEVKCKGGARTYRPAHVIPAQPVVVYPPWIVMERGERAYAPQYQPRQVANASRCNSDTVGRVLGGVVGGALGNQIGKGSGRTAATIGGAVAGVLIGGEVGKRLDAGDHACVGQVLEVAPVDHRVQWVEGPAQYVVVPGKVHRRQSTYCRPFTVEVTMDGQRQRSTGTACRRADGVWVAG